MPPPTLPTIDISPFLPPHTPSTSTTSNNPTPTPAQLATAHALHAACTTHGFFYLTSHSIPSTLTSDVLSLARTFFLGTPTSQKTLIARRNPPEGDGARGYQVIGENVTQGRRDWHEGVDWYRPVSRWEGQENAAEEEEGGAKVGQQNGELNGEDEAGKGKGEGAGYSWLQGPNLWPLSPPTFRHVYEEYVSRMLALGTAVVRAMGVALELDDPEFFVARTRRSFWVMRAIGYPPLPPSFSSSSASSSSASASPPSSSSPTTSANTHPADGDGDGDGISCGAHTDYGCVTLLLADATPGALQVQTRAGDWIDADPVPGAFVVNVGDMMERWTNGLWASTRHRVVHRGRGYRVSVPFFFEPDFEAAVGPLRECVLASGGRRRFDEVRYGEHLLGKVRGNFVGGG